MKSGKVLQLKPKATFFINGDDIDFLEKDFLDNNYLPLAGHEKLEKLTQDYSNDKLELVAFANTTFIFQFGLGRHTTEEHNADNKFIFKAKILEELYFSSKTGLKWRMCDCVCEVFEKVRGDLDFEFKPIKANSLSELFAKVISNHFNRKRSTACNAFTTFHQIESFEKYIITLFLNKIH